MSTEEPWVCDASTMTVDLTKVDAYVSTEDPGTCDASTMTMDPTVMCVAYTQTETGMDGGGAAAKEENELELEIKKREAPGTRGGAGGLKAIVRRLDAQHEERGATGKEICRGACHQLVRRL